MPPAHQWDGPRGLWIVGCLQEYRIAEATGDGKLTPLLAGTLIDQCIAAWDAAHKPKRIQGPRKPPFRPPEPGEVELYSIEIGWPLDGQAWCDHYARKGWIITGQTKMSDWQAGVRYWKNHGFKTGVQDAPVGMNPSGTPASLGALQVQLGRIEEELSAILYPGGSAYKVEPIGEKRARYDKLFSQRQALKERIASAV